MTLTEIIDGLLNIKRSAGHGQLLRLDPQNVATVADEAIAHLQPHTQPITPEGLEARGFTEDGCYLIRESGEATMWFLKHDGSMQLEVEYDRYIPLPGVRTLGDVDDLIRMLEGGE